MAQRALVYKYDSGEVLVGGALAIQAFCLLSDTVDAALNRPMS